MARTEIHYTGKESKTFPNGGEQITILDGRMKYKFSTTKKDGGTTKAYESWQKLTPKVGDILPAEVNEEEKEFQDPKTGKTVKYTDRRVMYFYTDADNMTRSNINSTAPASISIAPDMEARLKALEDRVAELEKRASDPQYAEDAVVLDEVPF